MKDISAHLRNGWVEVDSDAPGRFDDLARRFVQEPETVAELLEALGNALRDRDAAADERSPWGELSDGFERADAAVDAAREGLLGEVEAEGLLPVTVRLSRSQAGEFAAEVARVAGQGVRPMRGRDGRDAA